MHQARTREHYFVCAVSMEYINKLLRVHFPQGSYHGDGDRKKGIRSKRPLDQNGLNQNGLYGNGPLPKRPLPKTASTQNGL